MTFVCLNGRIQFDPYVRAFKYEVSSDNVEMYINSMTCVMVVYLIISGAYPSEDVVSWCIHVCTYLLIPIYLSLKAMDI